jgi:hypothetical protein
MGDPDSFDGWRISLPRRVFLTPVGPLAVASLPFTSGFTSPDISGCTGVLWATCRERVNGLGPFPGMHCQHWKTWEDLRTFSPLREELLTQRKA